MKLKDQICSLELSKRLKELGVKQESLFWWWVWPDGSSQVVRAFDRLDMKWKINGLKRRKT